MNSNNIKLPLLPTLFVEDEFNTETFKIDEIIKIILVAPVLHRVQAIFEHWMVIKGLLRGLMDKEKSLL